jgi:hypothetical protein
MPGRRTSAACLERGAFVKSAFRIAAASLGAKSDTAHGNERWRSLNSLDQTADTNVNTLRDEASCKIVVARSMQRLR